MNEKSQAKTTSEIILNEISTTTTIQHSKSSFLGLDEHKDALTSFVSSSTYKKNQFFKPIAPIDLSSEVIEKVTNQWNEFIKHVEKNSNLLLQSMIKKVRLQTNQKELTLLSSSKSGADLLQNEMATILTLAKEFFQEDVYFKVEAVSSKERLHEWIEKKPLISFLHKEFGIDIIS